MRAECGGVKLSNNMQKKSLASLSLVSQSIYVKNSLLKQGFKQIIE